MNDLIARLEAATGPDRELNKLLAPLVGLRLVEEGHPLGSCCYDRNGHGVPLPNFTASIDAALALVPEGWGVAIVTNWMGTSGTKVGLQRSEPFAAVDASSSTPALAIVIAALKAKDTCHE